MIEKKTTKNNLINFILVTQILKELTIIKCALTYTVNCSSDLYCNDTGHCIIRK